MSVIDRAYVPQRPVPPGRSTIAAIAGGATVLLGALVMLLCAALDDRIFLAADVEGLADVLVQVPRVRRRRRAHAPT
jgi:capsular polysaccharide biosynthesis protein